MNIFYLDHDQATCAKYHCDKHVVKMILETAQILCATHDRYGEHQDWMYKPTHVKHPCTLWAGDSVAHYDWLQKLGMELCYEYTRRYGKVHKTQAILEQLKTPPIELIYLYEPTWDDPPRCMPDECKAPSALESYKIYYKHKQSVIDMKWERSSTNVPHWFNN